MGWVLAVIGILAILEVTWGHRRLMRTLQRRARPCAPLAVYPSVTVIRPVRGRDCDAEANFEAALDVDYPGDVETLFLFDDEEDPGLPLARAVVERHRASGRPGTADVKVVGHPPPGWTGKLNAMRIGQRLAKGELIAFGDSDTRPDRHVLRKTVEALKADSSCGAAFAPIVARGENPTAGDSGYALLLNAWYHPLVANAAASVHGRMPFLMGQLMVFTREGLDAIGGIDCAEGRLVDDMFLGQQLLDRGLNITLAPHLLPVVIGRMSLPAFVQAFRRWLIFARAGLPLRFTAPMWLRGVGIAAALGVLVAGAATGHFGAALLGLLGLGAYTASIWFLQQESSGSPLPARHMWLALSIPFVGGWVFFSGLVKRQVAWRGRSYALDPQARLARPVFVPGR